MQATRSRQRLRLCCVCHPERDLSDIVIVDAEDFAAEPTATIRLPVRFAQCAIVHFPCI